MAGRLKQLPSEVGTCLHLREQLSESLASSGRRHEAFSSTGELARATWVHTGSNAENQNMLAIN